MIWIRPMGMNEAQGAAKEIIESLRARRKPVPKLFLALGRRPDVLAGREAMRAAVCEGRSSLGRRREEMLHFYVAFLGG